MAISALPDQALYACHAGRSFDWCGSGRSSTIPAPNEVGSLFGIANSMHDPWVYEATPAVAESSYGTSQIGQTSSPINVGLRDHSLRTPGQYQQNFPREVAITEAAVLAGVDPLQFRFNTRARSV